MLSYLAQNGTENPLVPNPTELVLGIFAFFLIFGILAKLLMPRITKTLLAATLAIGVLRPSWPCWDSCSCHHWYPRVRCSSCCASER